VRTLRPLLAVFTVGALSLTFTACGDDDGGTLGAGSNPSKDDIAQAIEDQTDGEVSADEVKDALEGLDEACLGAAYLYAGAAAAMTDEASAEEAKQYFESAKDSLPDEIRDDFEVVAAGMEKYFDLIGDEGFDITKAMTDPDVQKALEDLDSPEFTEASDNVTAWLDDNCDAANN
jgi:hypothetical protein